MNHYANKKSAAESMLDIALLMANASQLKAVVEQGPSFAFFVPLVVLISISLALQISVGVLLIFLGRSLALSSPHGRLPPCTPGSHGAAPSPALLCRARRPGFDPPPPARPCTVKYGRVGSSRLGPVGVRVPVPRQALPAPSTG
ncbi:ninjurin-1 [Marmota marmota marmota]|uniref:ninjurin-1 n=1 Tax=Marmota marmota marmota TaxID=9994 RepID=UPI002092C7DA|nr:ninjurin-1 [Marmota marmota marmota]